MWEMDFEDLYFWLDGVLWIYEQEKSALNG